MTDLVAMLTTGKGTWSDVAKLINAEKWQNIYLITNLFGAQKFSSEKQINFVVIDPDSDILTIKKAIYGDLKGKLGMEVALNMNSGSGKEHLALISALLQLGVGIRFVAIKGNEMIEV